MATKAAELYGEDFHAWTRDQAASLRRMGYPANRRGIGDDVE